jgi:undecaprenyl-diphosphatase
MTIFNAILLGIVQGLTEFIPVSSTAHLLISQKLLGIASSDATFSFLVLVQLGTILSLFIFFWKDLLELAIAFFARPFSSEKNKLAWYIIIATIPALLVGYALKDTIETLFKTPLLEAGIRLMAAAVLLASAERLDKQTRTLKDMTWLDALFIGFFQVIAVFPGASRSGTTISGGMFRGFDRYEAARFAFLMSVPVLLAAGIYETKSVIDMPGTRQLLPSLITGFTASAIVGWVSLKWLMEYLHRHSLYVFAGYCALVGAACLLAQFVF